MKISKYIHSCLLVEEGDTSILFDPGKFSFNEKLVDPDTFKNLQAIAITHNHPDHLDFDALKQIAQNNPDATLLADQQTLDQAKDRGIELHSLLPASMALGDISLRTIASSHADILSDELPENTAYVLNDTFLNPGDSFSAPLLAEKGIKVLALPVAAPWETELDAYAFAQAIDPKEIIPVHDGHFKDFFRKIRYETFDQFFTRLGKEFHNLAKPGDSASV